MDIKKDNYGNMGGKMSSDCNAFQVDSYYEDQNRWSKSLKSMSVICAILVVFIHAYNVEEYRINSGLVYFIERIVSQNFSGMAVPFFFISSAFFLFRKRKNIKTVYVKKFKSIFIPYIIWNAFYTIAFMILGKFGFVQSFLKDYNISNFVDELFFYKSNYTFWYIYQLLLFILLYPLILWVVERGKMLAWAICLIIWLLYFFKGDFIPYNGPHFIRISSLGYYFIGAMLGKYYDNIVNKHLNKKLYGILFGIVGSVFILCAFLIEFIKIQNVIHIDFIRNLSLILLTWMFINKNNIQIDGWISKITFAIYVLHPIILEGIEKIFMKAFSSSEMGSIIDYIFAPIISIVFIYLITKIWNKIFPQMYKFCMGGR